ncbi:nickel-dependent hydrogenase large subunit [Desulfosporosinus sp. PR]|uniref:nickel-dependent hydrogenase large subunit n=1 Tax=Candidatus Desulfosporosinus nitrosoreducens TaxID=3401928 RepID=UPI0027FFAEBA|nr:nickel-dependent hydrogenase large subunit [Desulfosporosinus sp. PR]MDQ7095494.1 nickel-dependent hydrogenase large subunit [Desulfosporosinus sp. PR]
MTKIVVDPLTRIEGHLKIEVEVDNGKISEAHVVGTMFRGIEPMLRGRDPRDATYVTERVCGVCAGSHGWASSLALDKAFGAKVPAGGRIIRNLILGAMWLHDHPLHFYHLSALDYLDVMAVAQYQGKDPGLLAVKDKVMKLVAAGDTAPLTPRYKPDEFSVNNPELVTMAVAHYLKALEMQAKAKKMSALFAGKQPHQSSIVVGGVTMLPNIEVVEQFRSMLLEQLDFVEKVYLQDVLTFGTGPLLPLAQAGVGGGALNYMSYGGFARDDEGKDLLLKSGVIMNGDLSKILTLDESKITEDVQYSWYKTSANGKTPYSEDTIPDLDKKDAYTFVKAPRYDGKPMEVGPLARMLIMQPKGLMDIIAKYNIKPGAVARHAARAYETLMLAQDMLTWLDALEKEMGANFRIHDTEHWEAPATGQGSGLTEAPRGSLGHFIKVADHKIENYQMVVPTTWNFSPRDDSGVPGPLEQALIGVPVPDPENPLNIVRVVRSYDPCLACAIHLIDPKTNDVQKFRIGW